jgi:hypothetical protein
VSLKGLFCVARIDSIADFGSWVSPSNVFSRRISRFVAGYRLVGVVESAGKARLKSVESARPGSDSRSRLVLGYFLRTISKKEHFYVAGIFYFLNS